ncbi:histone-lysine prdm9-like n-methyltransferase, partial [Mytilus galloprovincialis]
MSKGIPNRLKSKKFAQHVLQKHCKWPTSDLLRKEEKTVNYEEKLCEYQYLTCLKKHVKYEIPKLANMEQSDFRKFEEDARSGDIEQYFTNTQMASLSDYEKLRYRNMKKNYEMMVKMGLPAQKPEFMKKQIKNPSTKQTDFASEEEWKPSSSKQNIAQKPTFMQRSKKKRRVKHTDDSDEEWRPSSEKAKKSTNPPVFKLLKKTRKAKSEKIEQTCADEKSRKKDEENKEVHRYPQRQLPRTNYMYLEVPDDDEFICK